MIELAEGQYELLESTAEDADGLHMGIRTPVNVREFDPGTPELDMKRSRRPLTDGVAYGRDFRGERLYTLQLNALSWRCGQPKASIYGLTPGADPMLEGLNVVDAVEAAWASDRVRAVPGAVQVLRWRLGGRTRRIYGRPGRCAPDTTRLHTGNIPVEADFEAEDDLVYSDLRRVTTTGIVPPPVGGATWPLRWPVQWGASAAGRAGVITIGGTRPTWPTFTVRGPLGPQWAIVIGGYGELQFGSRPLAYDQALYVDTRPWNRGIRLSDGSNQARALDRRSTTLPNLRFPPGTYSVALKGVDPTGTAQLVVEHRDAHSSI